MTSSTIGKLLSATVAAAAILAASQGAEAQTKKYVFALVPKNTNNPFFDQARDGCKKAERELGYRSRPYLEGVADAEPIYRLVTTILDPTMASAEELAALYHERWEIETTLDEFKTHLRGAKIVLRSICVSPDLPCSTHLGET